MSVAFPTPVSDALPNDCVARWQRYYAQASDRNRTREEGIWRRTQTPLNVLESGWTSASDQRRRIVHYAHDFELVDIGGRSYLAIVGTYIYYSLSLPAAELDRSLDPILSALAKGNWTRTWRANSQEDWRLGALSLSLRRFDAHPQDTAAGRELSHGYRSLDIVASGGRPMNVDERLPWKVLAKGMRSKDPRGRPIEVENLAVLKEGRPFHVEIGCGVSIEAGVPALHHLHELYRVTDIETGQFIFGGSEDDLILRLIMRPQYELSQLSALFLASLVAEPTVSHHAMRALRDSGHLVGPIMTNNFDGLAHRAGLTERFLRRYDETIPPIDFDERARSLLVIGSHADRRRVQARARDRGLQVVFLDTEGYFVRDRFVGYPLEGPQDRDVLCRKPSAWGLADLCSRLGVPL